MHLVFFITIFSLFAIVISIAFWYTIALNTDFIGCVTSFTVPTLELMMG